METARIAETKNRFDLADRDCIRRALLRYMQQRAIGVPTLQKEIATANNLTLDRVPLKTLQRFLGDTHRSNDALIRFCAQFVGALQDSDPLAAFGEQMAAFLGVWRDWHDCRPVPLEMTGRYSGRARRAADPGGGMRVYRGDAEDWVPFSAVEIEAAPAHPFAIVREFVSNWDRRPAEASAATAPRRAYEGIAIHPNGSFFVVMRNVLTGTPRIYWLDWVTEDRLGGQGHESRAALDAGPATGSPLHSSTPVLFDRAKEGS
ncbi:hypothetical protein [Xanthobacter autotrophicus]|uniref:hypothetical protein n=1 Tax=Xanthobacter autotrophicus TaxID=280 RepID=UPI0037281ED1